ncbi:MAG: AAA family ATPase [Phycisphaerae bacterium]|nr:AAA family ATPase [Phycisphaerae bacterium]
MITKLRLHNFKTFLNFEVGLTGRHLFIGKNNSGKSNLCYALRLLGASACTDYDKAMVPGGLSGLCHRGFRSSTAEFECHCTLPLQGQELKYEYRLHVDVGTQSPSGDVEQAAIRTHVEQLTVSDPDFRSVELITSDGTSVKLLNETRFFKGDPGEPIETRAPVGASMLSKLYQLDTNPRATLFKRFVASITYHALAAPLMRYGWTLPSDGSPVLPGLGWHGNNLPFALFHLKNEDEPRYRSILEYASLLEPEIDSIGFFVTPDNRPTPYVMLKGGHRASWDSLSDGTLYVLALVTVFMQAERSSELGRWPPPLIVIEEPENGLFRGLLRTIWDRLSSVAVGSQFILTSHSPYFIDLFDRDLSSVTCLKKDGGVTVAKSLEDARDTIEQYRGDFSLGELHYKEAFE